MRKRGGDNAIQCTTSYIFWALIGRTTQSKQAIVKSNVTLIDKQESQNLILLHIP